MTSITMNMPRTLKSQTVPLSFRSIYPNKDQILLLGNFKTSRNMVKTKLTISSPSPFPFQMGSLLGLPSLVIIEIYPIIQARTFKTIFDISLSLTLHFSYVTKTGPFSLPDTSQIPQPSSISTSTSLLSLPLSHLDPWDSFLTDLPKSILFQLQSIIPPCSQSHHFKKLPYPSYSKSCL